MLNVRFVLLFSVGALCAECTNGKVLSASYQCQECLSTAVLLVLSILGILASVMALRYYVNDLRSGGASAYSDLLKICVSYLQFNVIALSFAFNWEEAFASALTAQDAVTTFGTAYFELECLLGGAGRPILVETLVFALTPLLVVSLVWVGLGARGNGELAKTVIVVVFFLLQPTLTKRTMLLFSCVSLGAGANDYFLAADLSTRCWTSEHLLLVLCLGVPMLVVYALGVLFGFFLLLYRNRDMVGPLATPSAGVQAPEPSRARVVFQQNYGFLWSGYDIDNAQQPVSMYWEVVIVCRKTLLNMVAVFFSFNSHAQAVSGFAIVAFAAGLHSQVYPFAEQWLNRLELGSLCSTVSSSSFVLCRVMFVAISQALFSNWVVSFPCAPTEV